MDCGLRNATIGFTFKAVVYYAVQRSLVPRDAYAEGEHYHQSFSLIRTLQWHIPINKHPLKTFLLLSKFPNTVLPLLLRHLYIAE